MSDCPLPSLSRVAILARVAVRDQGRLDVPLHGPSTLDEYRAWVENSVDPMLARPPEGLPMVDCRVGCSPEDRWRHVARRMRDLRRPHDAEDAEAMADWCCEVAAWSLRRALI